MVYQASLMKSCIESFGTTMLTTQDPFVQHICDMINTDDLPPFNTIFRSYLSPTPKSKPFIKTKNRLKMNRKDSKIKEEYDFKEEDASRY